MSQIFDELGIYDLVAVLLSGICITTFSILADQVIFQSHILCFLKVKDTIPFLALSYFIGLVFQEVSSIIQKKIYKNNRLLLKALDTSEKSNRLLTQEEKDGIVQAVQTEMALQTIPNVEILYNYCKFYLISTGNTARVDKDQSIFGMSRSLSLYFCGLALFTAVYAFKTLNALHFVYVVVSLGLSILLYYRCIRFAKMRYIYILRSFYYSLQQSKSKWIAKDFITK